MSGQFPTDQTTCVSQGLPNPFNDKQVIKLRDRHTSCFQGVTF